MRRDAPRGRRSISQAPQRVRRPPSSLTAFRPVSQPRSPASILMMTSMHELEALRALLESALVQVQMPVEPRTSH
ncbi:hypothetical protein GQL56_07100 [Pseudomonas putida]|nr:hypothetical protein [Pseudomonas putida]